MLKKMEKGFRKSKDTVVTANIQCRSNGFTTVAIPPSVVRRENLRKGGKITFKILEIQD